MVLNLQILDVSWANPRHVSSPCAGFEKYDLLVFDYYGVSADQIEYLENIVDVEISKEKCAIVIDRLEFNQEIETNKNITRLEISTT